MLSNLWGRITGKDKKLQYPAQQTVFLGRVGEHTVIFPYGLYADLPAETLLKEIGPRVAVSVTVSRPADTEQGEPVFFHPVTGSRIIMRNNGDIEVIGAKVKVTASTSITLESPETTITGNLTVDGDTALGATVTSDSVNIGSTHTHVGSATAPVGAISPTGVPVP